MLRLIGRAADGWIPSLGMASRDELRSAQAVIDEAADAAGRDPSSIRRLLNVGGLITAPGPGDVRETAGSVGQIPNRLAGPPAYWHEVLGGLREIGFGAFVFWPAEATVEQVERLAHEVAPLVRGR
jgi:alkanesulfonate monooxygenase SsuD/methylene tetrahydromethanopterin reductase-like flavin-dependent oxidoreductase (luciferase family)